MPPKKKSKQPQRPPETADEYLAEAVFQEESAEKWRAGDAKKAARFYSRALGIYEEALKLFPASFDLRYNKARIQFEIAQRPAIGAEFSTSVQDLLEDALESHNIALSLAPESDADAMFNTAQVLTSLAEAIDDDSRENNLLQQAVSLFYRCLNRQELLLEQSQAQVQQGEEMLQEQAISDQGNDGVSLNQPEQNSSLSEDAGNGEEEAEADSSPSDQWATIVNPITYTTLLETCVSVFSTISTLCTIFTQPQELSSVQPIATTLIDQKLPAYAPHISTADSQETLQDLALEILKYYAAFTDAQYRLKATSFETYDATLKHLFSHPPQPDLPPITQLLDPHSPAYLTSQADALATFSTSTADVPGKATLRYTRLSKALDCLAEAARHPAAKDVASIHISRGDAELLRFQLTKSAEMPENLGNNVVRLTLLGNAETFYRGAASVAQAGAGSAGGGGLARDEASSVAVEALTKEALVKSIIAGAPDALVQLTTRGVSENEMRKVVSEMVEDALITDLEQQQAKITLTQRG